MGNHGFSKATGAGIPLKKQKYLEIRLKLTFTGKNTTLVLWDNLAHKRSGFRSVSQSQMTLISLAVNFSVKMEKNYLKINFLQKLTKWWLNKTNWAGLSAVYIALAELKAQQQGAGLPQLRNPKLSKEHTFTQHSAEHSLEKKRPLASSASSQSESLNPTVSVKFKLTKTIICLLMKKLLEKKELKNLDSSILWKRLEPHQIVTMKTSSASGIGAYDTLILKNSIQFRWYRGHVRNFT